MQQPQGTLPGEKDIERVAQDMGERERDMGESDWERFEESHEREAAKHGSCQVMESANHSSCPLQYRAVTGTQLYKTRGSSLALREREEVECISGEGGTNCT